MACAERHARSHAAGQLAAQHHRPETLAYLKKEPLHESLAGLQKERKNLQVTQDHIPRSLADLATDM